MLREKLEHNFSSLELSPFFFENLCFEQPLSSKKNAPISTTVVVRIACQTLQNIPGGLLHSIIREKSGQNL